MTAPCLYGSAPGMQKVQRVPSDFTFMRDARVTAALWFVWGWALTSPELC